MALLKGYDATQDGVAALPTDGDFYAGYVNEPNQHFVSYSLIRARFPHKTMFAYTLGGPIHRNAIGDARLLVLDFETGNPDPNPDGWIAQQEALGWHVTELGVYANESTWNSGLNVRPGCKKVQAHYDEIAEVPPGFDCKQYSDKGGGGAYDVNVALDSFLNINVNAEGVANFRGSVHVPTGAWKVQGTPGPFRAGLPNTHWCAKLRLYLPHGSWQVESLQAER